jgi:hypothetical protein
MGNVTTTVITLNSQHHRGFGIHLSCGNCTKATRIFEFMSDPMGLEFGRRKTAIINDRPKCRNAT